MSPARARAVVLLLSVAAGSSLSACGGDRHVHVLPSAVGPIHALAATPVAATSAAVVAPAAPGPATDVAAASAVAPAAPVLAPIPPIDGGPNGLTTGSRGPAVAALEARLADLRFDPGRADGAYDGVLLQAVMAFQKQQGLPRTGKADRATLAAVSTAALGAPIVATGEPTRVEVDLERQIAQFWAAGQLLRVIPISSGNGAHYCIPKDKGGGCDTAITPAGSYRADRKIPGDHESKLGHLYDPVFFNGGIALHGSPSVPAGPASHGCIRVPMWESRWVYETVAIGDPVYVVGGDVTPVPFGETAPADGIELTTPTDPTQ